MAYFPCRDYGLDIYGNGRLLKHDPAAVNGFIRATIKGVRAMVRDPEQTVQMTLQFRLKLAMSCCMITPARHAERAQICRALIPEAAILLLDEPFAALDTVTRKEICGLLQGIWLYRRSTVVLVAHELREEVY